MKFYVTRHGQVAEDAEYFGDVAYPKGDMPLSRLGREQAEHLGRRLRDEGFSGRIFSSPYLRTMETADIIADITGSKVYPTASLHEIFRSDEAAKNFCGSDIAKLSAAFKSVAEDASLEFPWWPTAAESVEDVRYRVALFLDKIMSNTYEDVLLVGHGASVSVAMQFFLGGGSLGKVFNCSYNSFDTKTKKYAINCVKHLPYKKLTYNGVFYERRSMGVEIPEELTRAKGLKILHIGDTPSHSFPYYRELINKLKPDVIIHTGDTVDEIKVGRIDEVREEYIDRLAVMLEIMTETGSRVIWTSGNNDLEDKVRELAPSIEVVPADTVLDIGGKRFALAHKREHFTKEADVYLYGHSPRYELWSIDRNTDERPVWYLNAYWSNSVIILPERKLYKIDRF